METILLHDLLFNMKIRCNANIRTTVEYTKNFLRLGWRHEVKCKSVIPSTLYSKPSYMIVDFLNSTFALLISPGILPPT